MAGSGALFKVFHRGHVDLGKESTRAEIANKTGNLLRERPAGFNVPTTFPPCGYSPLPRAKGTIVQSTLAYGGGPLLQSRRPGRGDGMLEIAMSGSILHSGLQFVDPVRPSLCIGCGSVLGILEHLPLSMLSVAKLDLPWSRCWHFPAARRYLVDRGCLRCHSRLLNPDGLLF